ncbi:MAG: Xaa-Pro peptidase family protein [Deltaproteobacteria bacterium]|nr:Xaa-Pro peptidase family protein [Deltaproteobacteria bacterium]
MDKRIYQARRENLRGLLKEKGLGAMLVTLDANRYYLSGFELEDGQSNESSGCLVITATGRDWLCTDARYAEAASRLWERERVFIYGGAGAGGYGAQVNSLLKDKLQGSLGIEARCISLAFYEDVCAGLRVERADGLVEALRVVKSPEEVLAMRESCALNHKLMEWIPGALACGSTEVELAWKIEQFFRNNGASGLSFDSIVGINANAALPHARPGADRVGENCCVLVDAGCRLHDYCSDQTRTFWVGDKMPEHFLRALEQVKAAQKRALAAIHPGAVCRDVHLAAYNCFAAQGVEKYFTHGLGHGVGLQVHEPPRLNLRDETVLRPGMVVTVEPGLYYPAWGGVRWEYMALVTEDGCVIF